MTTVKTHSDEFEESCQRMDKAIALINEHTRKIKEFDQKIEERKKLIRQNGMQTLGDCFLHFSN